jgi:hypothetical protein
MHRFHQKAHKFYRDDYGMWKCARCVHCSLTQFEEVNCKGCESGEAACYSCVERATEHDAIAEK